ncbi:MAG: hypothetical protein K0U38_00660, partial [Epsilonproteobacteria bacterium]|nr:hypothetical protein [Campylobacterota bacterium]
MQYRYLLIALIFIFTACGNNGNREESLSTEVKELETNTSFESNATTVTIYVHGYQEEGYKKEHDYGQKFYQNTFRSELIKFTGLPTLGDYDENNFSNVITAVDYYGKDSPDYYTQQDSDDVSTVTEQYGGGIPRYALIVAKFAKQVLKESGAERVNIVSVSMGSLVTRWMIEKNIENLASDKKIEKWMSVEGVIRGNYALSVVGNSSIINAFIERSYDTEHMTYQWIKENLTPTPEIMPSPYYKDILVGQISLTDGKQKESMLKYVLPFYGGFQPNDGFQLLKDTYFQSVEETLLAPSHTYVHKDHISVDESNSVFASISSFLEAKRRIRVTLVDATVSDIHESISENNRGSEIIFESRIASNKAKERWGIEDDISERLYESGALTIYNYPENGTNNILNQIIFDDFVLEGEESLQV